MIGDGIWGVFIGRLILGVWFYLVFALYCLAYPLFSNPSIMHLVCPECKNDVNLKPYPNLAKEHVIECDICGITLMVGDIVGKEVSAEVVDEGK